MQRYSPLFLYLAQPRPIQLEQVQALEYLETVLPVYGYERSRAVLPDIWKSCRREILQSPDRSVEALSFSVIASLVRISANALCTDMSSPLDDVLEPVQAEFAVALREPDAKQFIVSSRLVACICAASGNPPTHLSYGLLIAYLASAAYFLLGRLLPLLMEQYARYCQVQSSREQMMILEVLVKFIEAAFSSSSGSEVAAGKEDSLLGVNRSPVMILLLEALRSSVFLDRAGSLSAVAARGLKAVLLNPDAMGLSLEEVWTTRATSRHNTL